VYAIFKVGEEEESSSREKETNFLGKDGLACALRVDLEFFTRGLVLAADFSEIEFS